jgi:hypothetical protein
MSYLIVSKMIHRSLWIIRVIERGKLLVSMTRDTKEDALKAGRKACFEANFRFNDPLEDYFLKWETLQEWVSRGYEGEPLDREYDQEWAEVYTSPVLTIAWDAQGNLVDHWRKSTNVRAEARRLKARIGNLIEFSSSKELHEGIFWNKEVVALGLPPEKLNFLKTIARLGAELDWVGRNDQIVHLGQAIKPDHIKVGDLRVGTYPDGNEFVPIGIGQPLRGIYFEPYRMMPLLYVKHTEATRHLAVLRHVQDDDDGEMFFSQRAHF